MSYDIVLLTDGPGALGARFIKPTGAYAIASTLRDQGYSVFVLNRLADFYYDGSLFYILDALIGPNTFMVGFSGTLFSRHKSKLKRKDGETNIAYKVRMKFSHECTTWPLEDDEMEDIFDFLQGYDHKITTVYGGVNDYSRLPDVKNKIDYFVVGLGEYQVLELVDHIKTGKRLPFNALYNSPKVLDYDRDGIKYNFRNTPLKYEKHDIILPNEPLNIEMARGCIFKCKFCDYHLIGKKKGDESYLKAKETIKAELKRNYDLFGTTKYIVVDDTFNESTEKIRAVVEAKEELGIELSVYTFIRLDLVARYPEQIDLLKRLGVQSMFLGIESLNWESAKAIGKGIHPDKIKETLYKIKDAYGWDNVRLHGSFIVGLPNDSYETLEEWVPWVRDPSTPLDTYYFGGLSIIGNSELCRNPEKYGYTVDERGAWTNEFWGIEEAHQYALSLNDSTPLRAWGYLTYQALGYTFHELVEKEDKFLQSQEDRQRLHDLWIQYKQGVLEHIENLE